LSHVEQQRIDEMKNTQIEMNQIQIQIQNDIRLGCLSFKKIAHKHGVDINIVNMVWEELCEREFDDE
jgi:DNA-binding transcriptional regulator YhcF (GntR family)